MVLSCGVIWVVLLLAVLIQYRSVTDRHTHTHRHTTTAYTVLSIESCGKNLNKFWTLEIYGNGCTPFEKVAIYVNTR